MTLLEHSGQFRTLQNPFWTPQDTQDVSGTPQTQHNLWKPLQDH